MRFNHIPVEDWKTLSRELAITFVGVLLALLASAWWSVRHDRRAEREILHEIAADLTVDSTDLATNINGLRSAHSSALAILSRLDPASLFHGAARGPDSASFDTAFARLGTWYDHEKNAAGYEALKTRGMGLITNDSLRHAIARFYETTYGEEAQFDRISAYEIANAEPVLHRYLRHPDYFGPAHPYDYRSLATDPTFRAFVDGQAEHFASLLQLDERTALEVRRLRAEIARELAT